MSRTVLANLVCPWWKEFEREEWTTLGDRRVHLVNNLHSDEVVPQTSKNQSLDNIDKRTKVIWEYFEIQPKPVSYFAPQPVTIVV